MADNLTTTTQVDPAISTFFDKLLLRVARGAQIHSLFAVKRSLKANSGNTMKWRRYSKLSTATTPLTEGVTPTATQLAKTDLTSQVAWYGAYVYITDEVELTNQEAVVVEAGMRLAQQMGETEDEIVRDIICATSSAMNCTNGVNGETITEINNTDIKTAVGELVDADALPITSDIRAGQGQGTSPIIGGYAGLTHTKLVGDFESVSGWRGKEQYPNLNGTYEAEFGCTGRVRWLFSSLGKHITSTSPDTFNSIIVGKEAYAVVSLDAATAKTIMKKRGSGGTEDPLDQRASIGWKRVMSSRILNDNNMYKLVSTRSDSLDG
jgi:N4-gp56 family major capsid protein